MVPKNANARLLGLAHWEDAALIDRARELEARANHPGSARRTPPTPAEKRALMAEAGRLRAVFAAKDLRRITIKF